MPTNKSQHFVPQHYLRQFRIPGTKQIAAARIEPYHFIERAAIKTQCKQDYFYRGDGALDDLLQTCETDLAPVLARVAEQRHFDSKELVALRLLAVFLLKRTRKATEAAKLIPRKFCYELTKNAIERGEIRPPSSELQEDMIDFTGVAGHLLKSAAIYCWLEMETLACKLLEADGDSFFITSDHPVILLNQLLSVHEPDRSYVGFSRSGFQLLLPIAPHLCLFFYDPKVYKVGGRRHKLVGINPSDDDLVNSLQIQNAEECVYLHKADAEAKTEELVCRYRKLRTPIRDLLRELPWSSQSETLLHFRQNSLKLARPWNFCTYKRHPTIGPDYRRDKPWTTYVEAICADMQKNPGRGVTESMEAILGQPLSDGRTLGEHQG